MSITKTLTPNPHIIFKKPFHSHNDSDDLDVFEASQYFSEEPTATISSKQITNINHWTRVKRLSLDMPISRTQNTVSDQKQVFKNKDKNKNKYKQPSSPGARIASFLNSLFSQSKKKPKSKSTDLDDDHHHHRRRRSSIGNFSTINTNPDQFSSPIVALSQPERLVIDSWEVHYEKFRLRDEGKEGFGSGVAKIKKRVNLDRSRPVFEDVDDGEESDSSSDLFELQNYDLSGYSR